MKNFITNFCLVLILFTTFTASAQQKSLLSKDAVKPRSRVMIDNDFGGDRDGLFQLVHHILSPSVEIRGIISSHYKSGGFSKPSEKTATNGFVTVKELLATMKLSDKFLAYEGSNAGLSSAQQPQVSDGAKAIVKEAMRADTKSPLYIVCGAGLTTIASAYLMEPAIANRITLIWIGGPEYNDLAIPPPGYTALEYNMGIDIIAGQVIFNTSAIPLWQIPRNTYRQALVSYSELLVKVKPSGAIGNYLVNKIETLMNNVQKFNLLLGETYILGDSPLVLLTALQSSFEADPSSSKYVIKNAPAINDKGLYEVNNSTKSIRVYTDIDNRLMFEDFFSKLTLFNAHK